jgi:hypothetical protein
MSWEVCLYAKHGNVDVIQCSNYTYNVVLMYKKAGIPEGSLNDLDWTPAKKMAEILAPVIAYMKSHPQEMIALSPSNDWDCYDGALLFLERIYNACRKYPRRIVGVS